MRVAEVRLNSWQELTELADRTDGFVFRGQADASWPLASSIERAYERYVPKIGLIEVGERWALHEFRQKFNLYSTQAPPEKDDLEWLALLQHHGCPTRLLDFTSSIYVAAHFATATAVNDAAVWAISHWAVRDSLRMQFNLKYEVGKALRDEVNGYHIRLFNSCIASSDQKELRPHLIPLEPTKLSSRMARQQGLFLAQTTFQSRTGRCGFAECLANSFGPLLSTPLDFEQCSLNEFLKAEWPAQTFACTKLTLASSMIGQALKHLRLMGITDEMLFPDLDGLARSLLLKHVRQ